MNELEWRLLEDRNPAHSVIVEGVEIKAGDRVRLRPRSGGDIMDLALAGKIATVSAIEQDYEGKFQLAVVIEEDPGKDLGVLRQPGHQFFFPPEEVQALTPEESVALSPVLKAKILVAGIGNIFMGDDGFGVEVAQRLLSREMPPEVKVADFGIRGFDLAYALLGEYQSAILVDACPRGEAPGTLYVVEPDLDGLRQVESSPEMMDAHGMTPVSVLRLAQSLSPERLKTRVLVVGCEPATLGPEEGQIGLSEVVQAAVDGATRMVEELVSGILAGDWPGSADKL